MASAAAATATTSTTLTQDERHTIDALCEKKCRAIACAIQDCLAAQNYKQDRCQHLADQWTHCCDGIKKRFAERKSAAGNN
eukprot:m.140524 g.140524  ORF g.140524 m.140524 type:complete len:81 (-) comp17087_c0_seq2:2330-2572(-)